MARSTQPDPSAQAIELTDPQMGEMPPEPVPAAEPPAPVESATEPVDRAAPAVPAPDVQPRKDRPVVHGRSTYTELDARMLGLTWP